MLGKYRDGYVVRVQLVRYTYATNGDCTNEVIVDSSEGKVFDKPSAILFYRHAKQAGETL